MTGLSTSLHLDRDAQIVLACRCQMHLIMIVSMLISHGDEPGARFRFRRARSERRGRHSSLVENVRPFLSQI
jgi:hypothetical protein